MAADGVQWAWRFCNDPTRGSIMARTIHRSPRSRWYRTRIALVNLHDRSGRFGRDLLRTCATKSDDGIKRNDLIMIEMARICGHTMRCATPISRRLVGSADRPHIGTVRRRTFQHGVTKDLRQTAFRIAELMLSGSSYHLRQHCLCCPGGRSLISHGCRAIPHLSLIASSPYVQGGRPASIGLDRIRFPLSGRMPFVETGRV